MIVNILSAHRRLYRFSADVDDCNMSVHNSKVYYLLQI